MQIRLMMLRNFLIGNTGDELSFRERKPLAEPPVYPETDTNMIAACSIPDVRRYGPFRAVAVDKELIESNFRLIFGKNRSSLHSPDHTIYLHTIKEHNRISFKIYWIPTTRDEWGLVKDIFDVDRTSIVLHFKDGSTSSHEMAKKRNSSFEAVFSVNAGQYKRIRAIEIYGELS